MKSVFAKMTREKRIKVLMLVLLLSVFNFYHFAKTVEITYVLKEVKDYYEPNCVAEDDMLNSAVGWIYPMPNSEDQLPKTRSRYVPTLESNYSCNFEKENHCSDLWKIDGWKVETSSPRNFELLLDTRWEELPVILLTNKSKDFTKKIEIPGVLDLGLSIRASNFAEIFLCEGWNPRTYPCYYIHIGKQTYLQKIKEFSFNTTRHLDVTRSDSPVLLEDEWRNFILSYEKTNTIRFIEVLKNETMLKFKDDKPLKPLYLFMRSNTSSLWRVHKNQFLQTTVAGDTKFGPPLKLDFDSLCVAFYVSMCEGCGIKFFIKINNLTELLKEIHGQHNTTSWQHIKLQKSSISSDEIQIIVSTFVLNNTNIKIKYWAVDDVRICYKDEIKVSTLEPNSFIKNEEKDNEYISCQAINFHKWRPEKHIHPILNVYPAIEKFTTETSVRLTWKPYPKPIPLLMYLIEYQGEDICRIVNKNSTRAKSHGYLITKEHQITIENLIPYTNYNISFSYLLHNSKKWLSLNTLPTGIPTQNEINTNVIIKPDVKSAEIDLKTPNCSDIHGTLCYLFRVGNFSKIIEYHPQNISLLVPNLQAFTNYTANIYISRNCQDLAKQNRTIKRSYTFQTKPDLTSPVENLELYSTDFDSVSLRYNLPNKPKGETKYVQVKYCNIWMLNKCNSEINEIKACKLWKNKYCIDINDLLKHNEYTFDVSLKNLNTHAFGRDVQVKGFTEQRVPGKPTNITYKMINCEKDLHYCHLNVSWLHPYQQNGTITSFYILLNVTENNLLKPPISADYKVPNKNYFPQYYRIIKYVPYSTNFSLSMKSMNYNYQSSFTTPILFQTENIGDHIDQSPKLNKSTGSTLTFIIPPLDNRLNLSTLLVIVQDYDKNVNVSKLSFGLNYNDLCNKFGSTWLALVQQLKHNITQSITIGDGSMTEFDHKIIVNKPLSINSKYCITFVVRNDYKQTQHEVVYYEKNLYTKNVPEILVTTNSNGHLYVLLVLILLVPVGFFMYKYRYCLKSTFRRQKTNEENVYESLPFEDCNNFVSNDTYDKLIHT